MSLSTQECKTLLRKAGLKSTLTRIAVLQQLWLEGPVSHSELVQSLTGVGDQVSLIAT